MKYAQLPCETTRRPLPFYLAMEEYLATLPVGEGLFFMWQVEPTVIFGRNQRIDSEVDTLYCRRHAIRFFRRKSGGGCVYADGDNIMMSAILPLDAATSTLFERYTQRTVEMLRTLGFNAEASGRNDVLVDGRKVSGGAVYLLADRCIIHGTMLFDTNVQHMLNAITPSAAKLDGRGIASVRSRITTLRAHMPSLSIADFKAHAQRTFCGDAVLPLSNRDVAAIYRLSLPYYHPRWIYGESPADTHSRSARIEGVGEFRLTLRLRLGNIERISLSGDYFPIADVDTNLLQPLVGCRYTPEAVATRLADARIDASAVVMSLTNHDFVNLLFDHQHL